MSQSLALILFVALYGWANRFAGGGFGWERLAHDHGGPLHGHSTAYAGLAAVAGSAGIGYALDPSLAAPAALLGLLWGACRSIPFINDSATPDTIGEVATAFGRHALLALCAEGVGRWFHLRDLGLFVLAWAIVATITAALYALADRKAHDAGQPISESLNILVEVSQGIALGAAIWAGLGGAATI